MRDSDWSRPNLLRSDWLLLNGAIITTVGRIRDSYGNTGKKFSSCLNIAFLEKYCYFFVYKQFICKRRSR